MPIQIPQDSALGKELWKWDHHEGETWESSTGEKDESIRGMRKREFQPFPKMLYKASLDESGKVICYEPDPPSYLYADPALYNRACQLIQVSNRQNTCHVANEYELSRKKDEGWRETPTLAIAQFESLQKDIAQAAAEAAFHAQRMTEKARAEFAAAEATTHAHVVDVKGHKKPGRKPKAVAPMEAEA